MAKQERNGGRGRRPGVVTAAKRGGPGRGFWIALGVLVLLGITATELDGVAPEDAGLASRPQPPRDEGGRLSARLADGAGGGDRVRRLRVPGVRPVCHDHGARRPYAAREHRPGAHPLHRLPAARCTRTPGTRRSPPRARTTRASSGRCTTRCSPTRTAGTVRPPSRPRGPIGDLAKSVGLDMTKYGACMDAETHRAQDPGASRRGGEAAGPVDADVRVQRARWCRARSRTTRSRSTWTRRRRVRAGPFRYHGRSEEVNKRMLAALVGAGRSVRRALPDALQARVHRHAGVRGGLVRGGADVEVGHAARLPGGGVGGGVLRHRAGGVAGGVEPVARGQPAPVAAAGADHGNGACWSRSG